MPIKTAIVDDEPLARRNLRALLKPFHEFEVVSECRNGNEALDLLKTQVVDLLFLDIQMPGLDGFQVIEQLDTERLPVIVFVTAFDEFALKAFEASATDYLLKPVDQRRFEQTLSRVKALLAKSGREGGDRLLKLLSKRDPSSSYPSRLVVKSASRITFLDVDEIDYITADDYYSSLHIGPKTHLLREPMKNLESRLDPSVFVRVHRSAIVNMRRVKELRRIDDSGYAVVLGDGTQLRISRSRWAHVESLLLRS